MASSKLELGYVYVLCTMYGDVGKTGKTWMLDSLCVLNRDKILYYKLILTMFPDSTDRVVSVVRFVSVGSQQ